MTHQLAISRGRSDDKGTIVRTESRSIAELATLLRAAQERDAPCSFDELCAARERERATKGTPKHKPAQAALDALKNAPWFTCATFSGNRRTSAHLTSATAFVGDADQPGVTRGGLLGALDSLGVEYIVATSTSHGCEGRARYRVIIPLAEPLTGTPTEIRVRYADLWAYFNERLSGVLDPGAKDPTRLNYMPRIPAGATGHEVVCEDGAPRFDVRLVPSRAAKPREPTHTEQRTEITPAQLTDVKSALAHLAPHASSNQKWCEVGYALLSLGDVGLELWREFSAIAPNGEPGAADTWWASHASQPPRSDFRHLFTMASTLGWQNPGVHGAAPASADGFPHLAEAAAPAIGEEFNSHAIVARVDATAAEQSVPHALKARMSRAYNLMMNEKGKPISNLENARRRIAQLLHGRLTYDEFLNCKMVLWPGETSFRPWNDADTIALQSDFQRAGMTSLGATPVADAAHLIAWQVKSNVVADWLHSLKWDGVRRLSTWMTHALGTPSDRYHIRSGRNMLISMVARALAPGCQVDTATIFEGPQGKLKSSALRVIGGEWFKELSADPNSKDMEQQLRGVWLGEFAELSTLRRPEDIARIKQFITNRVDHYRPSYGREEVNLPRRIVFCGTTNESEWIHDPTGGRRFIPIKVVSIDLEWLRANRDQLFAEATALFQGNRKWWRWPQAELQTQQAARQGDDPWESHIAKYMCGRPEINVSELLEWALNVPASAQTKANQTRVGAILRQFGCVRQLRRRDAGRLVRPWTVPAQYAGRQRQISGPAAFENTRNESSFIRASDNVSGTAGQWAQEAAPQKETTKRSLDPELLALLGDIEGVTT